MRWLLLGGGGFLGSHLSDLLLQKKQEVIIYDNNSFSLPSKVEHKNLHRYTGDIGNSNTLSSVINAHTPEIVCWMAAFHAYNVGENPFIRVSWLNYILNTTIPVVAAAKSKLILFSSETVYQANVQKIREDFPLKWAALKTEQQGHLIAEWYTQSLCNYLKVPFQIMRLSNIIGSRLFYHPVVDRLSFIIDNMITENETLVIVNPSQKRDYLYVNDAVQMIYKVVKSGEDNTVYNIASGEGLENQELLQILVDHIHPSVLPKVVEKEEPDIILDNQRAQGIAKIKITPIIKVIPEIIKYRKGL
jgi:UDP-glucose 4-epimerase